MIASRAHSIIAAALDDPALLARWRQEPELLRELGVDLSDLDLGTLWKFAGLALKVRHNKLRADFPLTFRLLSVAGLEIELFASYATHQANTGAQFDSTTEGRARQLIEFIEQWHNREWPDCILLFDLVRHEWALSQQSRIDVGSFEKVGHERPTPALPSRESVPRTAGSILLYQMHCDPRELAAILRTSTPQLDRICFGTHHFAYWRGDAHDSIHIFELDYMGFYLISLADGKRTAEDLNCLLGGGPQPSWEFLQALGDLGATGIIAFD